MPRYPSIPLKPSHKARTFKEVLEEAITAEVQGLLRERGQDATCRAAVRACVEVGKELSRQAGDIASDMDSVPPVDLKVRSSPAVCHTKLQPGEGRFQRVVVLAYADGAFAEESFARAYARHQLGDGLGGIIYRANPYLFTRSCQPPRSHTWTRLRLLRVCIRFQCSS